MAEQDNNKRRKKAGWRDTVGIISAPTPITSLGPMVAPGPPRGSSLMGPSREAQARGSQAATAGRAADTVRNLKAAMEAAAAAQGDEAEEEIEGEPRTWARRCANQSEAWGSLSSHFRQQYVDFLPQNLAREEEMTEKLKEKLQSDLSNYRPATCSCSSSIDGEPKAQWISHSDGEVTYYGLTCTFPLQLTAYQCSNCSKRCSVSPLAFGCLPSTPTMPNVWFDLKVLRLHRRQFSEGMSTTGEMLQLFNYLCSVTMMILSPYHSFRVLELDIRGS